MQSDTLTPPRSILHHKRQTLPYGEMMETFIPTKQKQADGTMLVYDKLYLK